MLPTPPMTSAVAKVKSQDVLGGHGSQLCWDLGVLCERDLVSVLGRKWALPCFLSMCSSPSLLESLFGGYLWEAPGHLPDLYKNSLLKQWGDTGRC